MKGSVRQVKQIIADVDVGLISGYVGTKVMEPVSMKLYELEPEAERQQEDQVRPGPLYEIAARKTAALLGLQLTNKQVEQAGLVFHYGLGMSWGTVYTLLRRLTPLPPPVASVPGLWSDPRPLGGAGLGPLALPPRCAAGHACSHTLLCCLIRTTKGGGLMRLLMRCCADRDGLSRLSLSSDRDVAAPGLIAGWNGPG